MNILTFFEETVSAFGQKTAIADQNHSYSFHNLLRMATRLSAQIHARKVCNQAVGVFANRDADAAVMFLAVLYSGCYYVPLDPSLPTHKLHAILKNAEISLLIGNEENRARLSNIPYTGMFLTLADITEEVYRTDLAATRDDAPLYMIYTSGSTGTPKGVLKSHGAMRSFVEAYVKTFSFCATDVIGNQTPFFFDASAKDFYLMQKTGATLEILPTSLFSFPVTLIAYLNERKVNFISWVPTALSIVTQLNTFEEILPTTLRRVFFVGEVMPMKQLNRWRRALPDLQYVNLYGSSEIAGICCYAEIYGHYEDTDILPMGKPLCNCEIFLQRDGQFVATPGEIGEVLIKSPALALEYYKDTEKTARQFIHINLPDGSCARVFRSGDLAKYDENGDLLFVSRQDYQIKHMGHRIELGEIEAVAGALEAIGRCCCLYDQNRMRITLFCELSTKDALTGREIQSLLRGELSDYMLPNRVVVMDRLPLNHNGKIDRQALKEQLEATTKHG